MSTSREIYKIPHFIVGDIYIEDIPATTRVDAHKNFWATTACGLERQTTLCTKNQENVRCQDCLQKIQVS